MGENKGLIGFRWFWALKHKAIYYQYHYPLNRSKFNSLA